MRKLIYSLLAFSFILVGCTTFDEYSSTVYPVGTSVSIAVDQSLITDSTFTFTITPAEGSNYYSYMVIASGAISPVDSVNLFGGKYKAMVSAVKKAADGAVTITMRNAKGPLCLPNTTYEIYAIAGNESGNLGKMESVTVTTTDKLAPKPLSLSASGKSVDVKFSENITRGTGAVTAMYFSEWDILNPVAITLNESNIVISGNSVTFSTPDVPSGATVCVSWEANAFKDVFGNGCLLRASAFNTTTGKFTGIYFKVASAEFTVKDSYFVSPAAGSAFADWTAFAGVATFDFNIYRNEIKVKTGDIKVVYTNATKSSTVSLKSSDWSVTGATLNFKLPESPVGGDDVTIVIAPGVIFDVNGNPNASYTTTDVKWTYFKFTKDLVLGNFNFSGISVYDNLTYDMGDFKMEEDLQSANSVTVKDFVIPNSELSGTYDLDTRKFYMSSWDSIGKLTLSGVEYEMYTFNYESTTSETIEFDIKANGTIVSNQLALLVYNPLTDKASFYDKFAPATYTKKTAASVKKALKMHASNRSGLKEKHLTPITDRNVLRHLRSRR